MSRQARHVVRSFAAARTGNERGPDRKVRRGSFDVGDARARVFRPIGDGTKAGALGWIDCLLKTVSEWDDQERRTGGGRPLGLHGLRVLEVLLGRRGVVAVDFKTGRLEPAIDTIARAARMSRTTVIRALARLKALGILGWVRRTQKTGNDGLFGPQREQISNAYWFDLSGAPARFLRRFRDLLSRKQLRRTDAPPAPPPAKATPADPALADMLRRLGDAVDNASPPSGQYPSSGVEG